VADAEALSERLTALLYEQADRPCAGAHSPYWCELTIRVPAEWAILWAWLGTRRDMQERNLDARFQETIGTELSDRQTARAISELMTQMYERFCFDIEHLKTGYHPALLSQEALKNPEYIDDDIPF